MTNVSETDSDEYTTRNDKGNNIIFKIISGRSKKKKYNNAKNWTIPLTGAPFFIILHT